MTHTFNMNDGKDGVIRMGIKAVIAVVAAIIAIQRLVTALDKGDGRKKKR